MKLKYAFEKMELDNEIIMVPVGNGAESIHAVIKCNDTACAIMECLTDETTADEIVTVLSKEYTATREQLVLAVESFISKLKIENLLDD